MRKIFKLADEFEQKMVSKKAVLDVLHKMLEETRGYLEADSNNQNFLGEEEALLRAIEKIEQL